MTETPAKPRNIWIILTIALLWIGAVTIAVLGWLAHSRGMLSNFIGLFLMFGFLPLFALRLPFAITKKMDWSFWKRPLAKDNRGRLVHVMARLVFWTLALVTFKIASLKYVFDAETIMVINAILYFGFVMLIIISLFPKRLGNWPITVLSILGTLFLSTALMRSLVPSLGVGEVVTVGPPIAGETLMGHAGHDTLVNYHVAYKSQKHALDIVARKEDGFEYMGKVKEEDPCFGRALLAPAEGKVVAVVSDLIDQEIGGRDPKNPAGNHVVIKMDEAHYAMSGHMKQNSATVSVGDSVREGQKIGECGNSGNTSKPHLHFQIQSHPDLFDKENYTYPVRFRDVTRVRGDKSETGEALYFRRNDIMIAD